MRKIRLKAFGMSSTKAYRQYVRMFNSATGLVYKDWFIDGGFLNFLRDMGEPPHDYSKLVKIDIREPYQPSNCKWGLDVSKGTKIHVIIQKGVDLNKSGVYMIEFDNGKFYIGSTKNFRVRLGIFKNKSSNKRVHNKMVNECILSCAAFTFKVLEEVSDITLLKKREEVYLLSNKGNPMSLNRSLNAVSNKGIKWTQEEKDRMSKGQMGIKKSGRPRKSTIQVVL